MHKIHFLKKGFCHILILIVILVGYLQTLKAQFVKVVDRVYVAGYVFEEKTGEPLPYVNVYVKKTRTGTITDTAGFFMLNTRLNDTIVFSSLGFDKKFVVITDSAADNSKPLIVFLDTKIYEIKSVEIIALRRYKQLEYDIINMRLEDDEFVFASKNFPFRPPDLDYYTRVNAPGFGFVFSPITALYDMFSKEGKEKQKLEEIQQKDYLNAIIDEKISLNLVMRITGLDREQTNLFLEWCNFSPDFLRKLTDYDLMSIIVHKHKQYTMIMR